MLNGILLFSICLSTIKTFNFFPIKIDSNRILISSLSEQNQNNTSNVIVKCFFVSKNYHIFDLSNMKYPDLEKDNYNVTIGDSILYFNFCNDTRFKCKDGESGQVFSNSSSGCKKEAGSIGNGNKWEVLNDSALLNESRINDTGIIINFNSGEKCNDTTKQIKFIVHCEKDKNKYNKDFHRFVFNYNNTFNQEECENEIHLTSYYACPVLNFYTVWRIIEGNKYKFSIILICFGVILLFLGERLEKITLCVLSFLTVSIVLFVVIFQYMPSGGNRDIIFWVTFVVSVVLGVVVAYYLLQNPEAYTGILLGISGGYILGTLIYSLFLSRISWHPNLVNIITILISIVAVFFITYIALNYILIVVTSLIGAYCIMRTATFFIGHYPSESTLYDLLSKGEKEEYKKLLNWYFVGYIIFWIILSVSGIVVQFKLYDKIKKEKEEENKHGDDALKGNNYIPV